MLQATVPLAEGKTKQIFETNRKGVIAFKQNRSLVTADGTTLYNLDDFRAEQFVEYHNLQSENLFNYLNAVGINSTFIERDGYFLFHKAADKRKGGALRLEFVVRLLPFGTMLLREPEYADPNNPNAPNSDFINPDGSVRTFQDKGLPPIMETFHKECLIKKPKGRVDMISESELRSIKGDRYINDGKLVKGNVYEDPILMTPNNSDFWYVYDQKSPIKDKERLATIHRPSRGLSCKGNFVRKMTKGECIDYRLELELQSQAYEIAKAIEYACKNTEFTKARFDDKGNVVFGERIGWAQLVDIKVEFAMTPDGPMLSDDIVITNMRIFFNGMPNQSMRGITKGIESQGPKLQNAESPEQLLLISAMFAKGSEDFGRQAAAYNSYKKSR